MLKNLFISSFKNSPKAVLISLALIIITNFFVGWLANKGVLPVARYKKQYKDKIEEAKNHKQVPLLIVGNSRAATIRLAILNDLLFKSAEDKVFNVSLPAAMLRTNRFVLEAANYRIIENKGTVLLCLTPMDFNRYNKCFEDTLNNLFTWKHFFLELVFRARMPEVDYYLTNCSFNLMRSRYPIQRLVNSSLFSLNLKISGLENKLSVSDKKPIVIDRNFVNKNDVIREMMVYKYSYLRNYTIDDYQIESLLYMIDDFKKKEIKVVFVILPLSKHLMHIIGQESLWRFTKIISTISQKTNIPVLDYAFRSNGMEYEYFDGAHFTNDSAKLFTERLARDLARFVQ